MNEAWLQDRPVQKFAHNKTPSRKYHAHRIRSNPPQNPANQICAALEQEDGEAKFVHEAWTGKLGIGETRVLKNGAVFEQAGVNFSHVKGTKMPASATAHRPELAGAAF